MLMNQPVVLDFRALNAVMTLISAPIPGAVAAKLPTASPSQTCDICGTDMVGDPPKVQTNKMQFSRTWNCPKCRAVRTEHSLVRD